MIAARVAGRRASTSTTCATRPTSSATRSCRWCTSWSKMCGEAGRYVHWGATTQDIMDTAVVLQVRAALDLIEADIRELRAHPRRPRRKHRDTPMAGRTHLQQALPVTFGYKVAIWLAMFDRHQERLAELRPRVLVGGVRRRRRHAGVARRQGLRGPAGDGRGAGARRAGDDLARGARRLRRGRELSGARDRLARQDRARRDDHGLDRVRRGLRAVRQGPRARAAPCRRSATRSRAS